MFPVGINCRNECSSFQVSEPLSLEAESLRTAIKKTTNDLTDLDLPENLVRQEVNYTEQIISTLVGVAIGDALGVPVEFKSEPKSKPIQ